MVNIIEIIIGAVLVVFSLIICIFFIKRTPSNLRGYYGIGYVALLITGFIGGITLITIGTIGII